MSLPPRRQKGRLWSGADGYGLGRSVVFFVGGWFKAACTSTAWGLELERLGECGAILCPPYLDPLRADYGWVLSGWRWSGGLFTIQPPSKPGRSRALPSRAKFFFSFFFIMRCPGRHRAEPTR
eukprot:scaffold28094_cov129-Isochrysis_galbana.AAC.1